MSRVLLVDDNVDHMAIATKYLERLNPDFEVYSVPSPQEALQKLQEQQFDVLISDYQMPEMDGLELLETLRNQGNDIPFVMFTGRGREEVAMQALNLGANHYLMKGGDLNSLYGELAHTISQLIAHRQTSRALEESEEKYHTLIRNIPVVTWMSDSEGGTSFISPNIEKVYGFTPREIYEKGEELWFGRIHPAEAETVKAKYQALFTAKEPFEAEYRIQRKDGKWIWLHDRAITIIEREGHSHAYGVFSDITKRKRLQVALQNQRDNAQRYLDISEALIVQLNREGKITLINKRGCDLLEYNENELIGKNWFDTCLPPKVREEIRDINRKLLAGDLKLAEYYENPIMTKHGEKKHIYWHNAFLRNAKSEIIGIISSGIDITGQKRAEEILRESEERFRVTFAHAPFGIGIYEPNGRLIDVNPAAQRMVGYTKEELISPSLENIIPSTHAQLERNLFKELIDGKRGHYQLEQPYIRKDNQQIWGRVTTGLARDDGGRPLFAIGMLEDITDHKRAEEALRESEERFRTIFQKSNAGIVLVEITEEGNLSFFIEANDAFCQLTGHSQAELTKFVPRDLVAPDEFERLRKEGIIGSWLSDEPINFESAFIAVDGTENSVEVNSLKISLKNKEFRLLIVQDITERKKAEEARQESEERFRAIFQESNDGIALVEIAEDDHLGFFIEANEAFCQLTNLPPAELAKISPRDLIAPEEFERLSEEGIVGNWLKNDPISFESSFTASDGIEKFIEVTALKVSISEKQYRLLIFHDITERRQAEKILEEREKIYRNTFDAIPGHAALWHQQEDGCIILLLANRLNIEFTQGRILDLIGKDLEEVHRGKDSVIKTIRHTMQTGEPRLRTEVETVFPDGTERTFLVDCVKTDEQTVLTIALDISDRKQSEKALEESERRYRGIVEDQTEFIVRWRPDGTRTFVNDAYCRNFGESREDMIGKSVFSKLPEEDKQTLRDEIAQLNPEQPSVIVEHRVYKPDGTVAWQEWTDRAIFDDEGDIIEIQSVGRDITARKEAEQRVQESEETARAILNASTDSMILLDPEGIIIATNEAQAQGLGKSLDEITGVCIYDFFPSDLAKARKARINEVLRSGISSRFEDEREGRIYDSHVYPIFDTSGKASRVAVFAREITKRKQAENALQQSEEKYRELVEKLYEGVIVVDTEEHITFANPRLAEMVGYSQEELTEMNWTDLIPAEEHDQVRKESRKRPKGISSTYESTLLTKNGETFPIVISASPLFSEDGDYRGNLGLFMDISEQKQAEEALRESEERFRVTFENAAIGMVVGNIDGGITATNPAFQSFLGYSDAELRKMTFMDYTHSEDIEKDSALYQETLEGNRESYQLEKRYIRKDKQVRWGRLSVSLVRDEKDQPQLGIGLVEDITDQKQAQEALQKSEREKALILQSTTDQIVYLDTEFKIIWANEATSKHIGIDPNDLAGKYCHDVWHHREKPCEECPIRYAMETGEVQQKEIVTIDGRVWIDRGYPVRDHEGSIVGAVEVATDITEQKQAEEELKSREKQLAEAQRIARLGSWEWTIVENTTSWSDELYPIFGVDPSTFETDSHEEFLKCIHPEDRELVERAIEQTLNDQTPFSVEYRIVRPDNEVRFIFDRGELILDEEGKAVKMLGTSQDITERKQAEKAVIESEMTTQAFMDALTETALLLDREGTILACNEATARGHKTSKEDLIGKKSSKLILPDTWEKRKARMDEVAQRKRPIRFEEKYGEKYLDNHIYPIFNDQGDVEKFAIYGQDITEQKRMENALRESEKKYLSLIHNIPIATWTLDREGKFSFVSPNTEQVLGFTPEEYYQADQDLWLSRIHSADRDTVEDELRALFSEEREVDVEYRIQRKDNKWIWVNDRAITVYEEKGRKLAYGVIMDISERKQIEAALSESEEKFRGVFEGAAIGIALVDTNGRILESNPAIQELFGYSGAELHSKPGTDFAHPDDKTKDLMLFQELVEGNRDRFQLEKRFIRKDGRIIWSRQTVSLVRDEESNPQFVIGMVEDITDNKQAEEALQESEEKYRMLVDEAPQGISIFQDDSFAFVNPAFVEMTGYGVAELLGSPSERIWSFVHPDDHDIVQRRTQEFLEGITTTEPFEHRFIRNDGAIRWVRPFAKQINFQGKPALQTIYVDITEQRQREKQVAKLQEEITEKNKLAAIGQLAAGVAHELNTPLMNIDLTVEYISSQVEQKDAVEADLLTAELVDIKTQVEHCESIVRGLLQYSRKIDLVETTFPAKPCISEIVESPAVVTRLQEQSVELTVDVEEHLEITGDKNLLIQVCQNIINNAIDAVTDVKESPKIKILADIDEEEVMIRVIDNGKGVRPKNLAKVFEPFFTTKEAGKGVGLGLAISKSIIEKHNGKIELKSTPGKGSEMEVRLPRHGASY